MHEEVRRGPLLALAHVYSEGVEPRAETRGEFVIVIAPPGEDAPVADGDVDQLLRGALDRVSMKDAVGEIVAVTGLSRRDIYQRALTLIEDGNDGKGDKD